MRGAAVLITSLSLAIVASAAAHPRSTTLTTRPCATIHGPKWSQTINVTANSPKKKARLRVTHGARYDVFADHLSCAWASHNVLRLIRVGIPWRMRDASPAGYDCRVGDSEWFRDTYNGDAVRQSEPATAIGTCLLPQSLGLTFHTFWWNPAKPCRSAVTAACRQ